jgi:hypothetical protein
MFDYRFWLRGPDNRMFAQSSFHAEDDFAALAAAIRRYRSPVMPHHGFEVWQGRRCVHRESCGNSANSTNKDDGLH